MAQQRELDAVALRIGRANNARHVPGLPIDDARHDKGEAATAIHLLPEIAGVDTTPVPVEHVARKRVHLLDLQEAASDARPERRLGHVLEDELGLEDPTEIAVRAIKAVLRTEPGETSQGDRGGEGFRHRLLEPLAVLWLTVGLLRFVLHGLGRLGRERIIWIERVAHQRVIG